MNPFYSDRVHRWQSWPRRRSLRQLDEGRPLHPVVAWSLVVGLGLLASAGLVVALAVAAYLMGVVATVIVAILAIGAARRLWRRRTVVVARLQGWFAELFGRPRQPVVRQIFDQDKRAWPGKGVWSAGDALWGAPWPQRLAVLAIAAATAIVGLLFLSALGFAFWLLF